jgi:hypothetical protein
MHTWNMPLPHRFQVGLASTRKRQLSDLCRGKALLRYQGNPLVSVKSQFNAQEASKDTQTEACNTQLFDEAFYQLVCKHRYEIVNSLSLGWGFSCPFLGVWSEIYSSIPHGRSIKTNGEP